ncbi:D-alanyl-D-alaninecarboxypeptidase/D-alanyl-D-alanine-endopeptidase [Pseudooceanicola batsensis HTCC2597]|uniref:D-alanyl-D-alaninecarboxypeptidase/D-alanyl-D-alanine-endopeptidase n=1 Tax=Pseudooceanicola batsensis (strain ATCC BAA-863 / DSM 15984 / KCTC 12145 / HTCC2597) TaxID=252305 RepID=A3U2E4_PSEBH|nr:D-alanyl-D-alanine carboxypeptidase/D-alanyl-D-alanine-endopeptidase [Pseudooceanicola batsensis]EAQ01744.1 D-alanyl-D-alaninecarboxypeptidase/D-alanyl-D-alanine-endopeptidase [Pseudooceanicola batsensis HTCC2597]
MTARLDRRAFLSALSAGAAFPSALLAAPPATSLRPRPRPGSAEPLALTAERIVEEANLSGEAAFTVFDLTRGRPLEARSPTRPMPPASVAKALTALYALDVLGPDHRFETRVLATGEIVDGVLRGDLVLAGGGDPTLQTDDMADLAAKVKETGLRAVEGRFLVWGGALNFEPVIDTLQPPHVGYNPAISGLSLNFNRVHFEWKRTGGKWGVTMDARSARYRPEVAMARMKVVNRSGPVYTYDDAGGRDEWTVAQGALGNGGSRWLPVRKPELYAGEVFQTMLRSHGIALKAPEVTGILPPGQVIERRQSQPLTDILRDMLKYSTNITAEMVGMSAAAARLGRPDSLVNSARAMSDWARETLDLRETRMVDHSGLGDRSRTTTGDLVRAMASPLAQEVLRPLLKEIPVRNEDYQRMSDHPLSVQAKTGTLNFVSTLAGFASLPDGTDLAFAILTADVPRRDELTEAQRERPPGGRAWARRSRLLQQALLRRWSLVHAG